MSNSSLQFFAAAHVRERDQKKDDGDSNKKQIEHLKSPLAVKRK
jgi:hypothetical protein